MRFGVLGALMVMDDGVNCLPSAPKQRQLLALLLMNANRFVSTEACIEELWASDPPRTVIPTLQTYILQIRKSLAASPRVGSVAGAHKELVTGKRGYYLTVAPGSLDLMEFERWTREGRDAARHHDDLRAVDLLRRALAAWRGPALSDVQTGPLLRADVDSLEEARISTLDQCFEVELRLGHHQHILSELCATAAQHPLNERLQAQYMLALYRSGRQAQALEIYSRLRSTLADELGLGPSLPLRRLHEAMLSADGDPDLVPFSLVM
ncbi:AfsR/SARP family transcriptional regulator [Thermomonospora umbrina]|uniref:DNA-binding SARP family transcriptional activator n=1 Tax=Thermomonospora umbrina TaxID=111806 RepID=A0A3D9T5H6_9ACTN|nr:AfsR/SARP family transcriptional regulator [Thermomonospora umbrina]REE99041.1 DNA-binding SARP family transcriptional activator [Thermomonospora umbrina]